MPSNRRSASESALWQRATRDVEQIRPRSVVPPAKSGPAPPRAMSRPAPPPPTEPRRPPLALDRFVGIDRANAERLKRGKHRIEARLDLHGMTQDEAHRALAGFVRSARVDGKRCVLVITGRGAPKGPYGGGGVLRAALPRWLDEPEFRPHVLAISTAQPRDGGAGALYVMLRRTRAG